MSNNKKKIKYVTRIFHPQKTLTDSLSSSIFEKPTFLFITLLLVSLYHHRAVIERIFVSFCFPGRVDRLKNCFPDFGAWRAREVTGVVLTLWFGKLEKCEQTHVFWIFLVQRTSFSLTEIRYPIWIIFFSLVNK